MRVSPGRLLLACTIPLLLQSCQFIQSYRNSSVVDFLYPDKREPIEEQRIPELKLPLRVGVAFTPTTNYQYGGDVIGLSEQEKQALMAEVSKDFKEYEFVKSIELIPSAYLKPQGGFANVDQLQRMFNIDVIALLSYDQTRFQKEGASSIAYWTLIGAYFVPAEKNDTHTLLDAAVYDIPSRSLLFRAPGVSTIKSRSTIIATAEQAREDSVEGFKEASTDLVTNLKEQLRLFQEKAKQAPEEVRIAHRPGYTGGGGSGVAVDFPLLILLLLAAVAGGKGRWSARG